MIKKLIFLLNAIILIGNVLKYNIRETMAANHPENTPSKPEDPKSISKERIFMILMEDLKLEFHMTIFCLDHVLEVNDKEKMKQIFHDYEAIKKEISESGRKYHQVILEPFYLDNMAFRISNRLDDFCDEILNTPDYYAKLRNIYWAEERAVEETFIEAFKKDNIKDKKKVVDDVESIKSRMKKHLDLISIQVSDEQLHSAAVRIGKFLSDFIGFSIKTMRTLPLKPDDNNDPL